jgi:hypothetical protein
MGAAVQVWLDLQRKIRYDRDMQLKVRFLSPSKTNSESVKRMKKYGFYDMVIKQLNLVKKLDEIIKVVNNGDWVVINQLNCTNKFIDCELAEDVWDEFVPRVTASNHPRFTVGTRFDYGFMCVALREGYRIAYNRSNRPS